MTLHDVIDKFKTYIVKITVDKDSNVFGKMNNKLDEYCNLIKELDCSLVSKATQFKTGIQECFTEYYNGNLYKSSNIMNNLVEEYKDDLYIHDMKFGNSINIYENVNQYLYKGIVEDWSKTLDREYMLHIPFDKREIIKTQRFSIPGVPCLYLGQSLFIVWEELDRPALDNLFVSRFELSQETKVLDLGLNISDLIQIEKHSSEGNIPSDLINNVIEKFIFTNIFKIACLISVKQENRYFKSEYILPQLLLMSIINLNIADGIRYSSVRVDNDSYICANYAFPAIKEKNDERLSSSIISKLKLTQPINVGLYDFIKVHTMNQSENLFRNYTYFDLNNEYFTVYENTKFYNTELKINQDVKLKLTEIILNPK